VPPRHALPAAAYEAVRVGNYYPDAFLTPHVHAHDYHVHSNYSDGDLLWRMVRAAETAGLERVGVADHCNVSTDDRQRRRSYAMGFNLDLTHERRREALAYVDDRVDVAVLDAVEVDYSPEDEGRIRAFLDDAGFAYALGSVHFVDGRNVQSASAFADDDAEERRRVVERYVEDLVALVESELFEVAAHVDLVERNPHLRGFMGRAEYDRVAAALADARTVPELNAGRALDDYGEFHPTPEFVAALREHDVPLVPGSDSHSPSELRERTPVLAERFADLGLEPARVV
jgi:histidinol-phosphatase (PHP family)